MKYVASCCALLLLLTAPAHAEQQPLPAGRYVIDPAHSTVIFRVSHMGFSLYTARFTGVQAELSFDPVDASQSTVSATIAVPSLTLDNPPEGFKEELLGAQWLDAGRYPEITFRSTAVEPTGETTANMTGDLTLHGTTLPVALEVTFNGGYAGHPMDPGARIGFSGQGRFKRSDFGVTAGIPAPGTTMGVGNEVEVIIQTEFTGPGPGDPAPSD